VNRILVRSSSRVVGATKKKGIRREELVVERNRREDSEFLIEALGGRGVLIRITRKNPLKTVSTFVDGFSVLALNAFSNPFDNSERLRT